MFLNQVCADGRCTPVLLKLLLSANVCIVHMCAYVCVSPPPKVLITSGVMWCDIDPI